MGLDFCELNEHSASFIDRHLHHAQVWVQQHVDLERTHCGEVASSLACQQLSMTVDIRGFHAVAAEAVPVFLNVLELQDFKMWEMQGRKRFHFDVI